ncbi:MAG TPA: DUF2905 domain-containing protein [Caulobacteraceae bacterium]|nr:DUF2905 domain-containing protein [Caulobacteraceae bacterium]
MPAGVPLFSAPTPAPQKWLIAIGAVILGVGSLWPAISRLGFGRLPGDIVIRRGGFTFYAPIATCLIVSAVVTLIAWLIRR